MKHEPWSTAEHDTLRQYAGMLNPYELVAKLPGRRREHIYLAIKRLGMTPIRKMRVHGGPAYHRPWSPEDIAYFKAEAAKGTHPTKIGQGIGRSRAAVVGYGLLHGILKKTKPGRKPWTKTEIFRLEELSEKYSFYDIGKRLHRPAGGVRVKMAQLGIRVASDCLTLGKASTETGYDPKQFRRARAALGQKWRVKRNLRRKGTHYSISFEQFDAMCIWLKNDAWKRVDYEKKFWSLVDKQANGCWRWTGAKYFHISYPTQHSYRPARHAWVLLGKPLIPTRTLLPRCTTPKCVNPAHHEPAQRGTPQRNIERKAA